MKILLANSDKSGRSGVLGGASVLGGDLGQLAAGPDIRTELKLREALAENFLRAGDLSRWIRFVGYEKGISN